MTYQDAVVTPTPLPVPPDRTHLITLAIALSIFTGPLSLAVWVPLNVMARRGGNRVLARWSVVMIIVMVGLLLALSLHLVFGTHGVSVLSP